MEKLPPHLAETFVRKGFDPDRALSILRTDLTREETFCDAVTLFGEDGIACLFTTSGLQKEKSARFFSAPAPKKILNEWDWLFVPRSGLKEIACEQFGTVLRLVARTEKGEVLLLYATMHFMKAASDFCEEVNEFLATGKKPEKDGRGGVCPRCHRPWDDPEKRICRHCRESRASLVRKLLPYFRRYSGYIFLVILTVLAAAALDLLAPYLSHKYFIDNVLTPGGSRYGEVLAAVLMIAGANLLVAVNSTLTGIVTARVSSRVIYDMKKTIFSSFERLSYSFFSGRHTGKLMTQINADATTLYRFFCDGVPYFITYLLQIAGIVVVMLLAHAQLTLIVLSPLPFLFLGYLLTLRHLKRLEARAFTKRSRFNSILSDVLGGMRIVKSFSREETEIERFHAASSAFSAERLNISLRRHTVLPFLHLLIRLSAYLVWGFGGYFVLRAAAGGEGISYGTLTLYLSYLTMLYQPLNFFAEFFSNMADALNAMQRLFQITDAEPDVVEAAAPVTIPDLRGEVEFEHVNFSYIPGKRAVEDISFRIPAGQTLGIVGHTGAGKSTLANLLTRLYDPQSGRILIDGVDIRELSFEELHRSIAIVSQETYLFRGSLLDNIRYAAPEATREEVIAAAAAAGAHDFIVALPDGYDTVVGMDKKLLSGGERQRISIARAILKDPKILVLDEATAAMDTRTERRIQEALEKITEGRTTITIAHRLSTLRDADTLIVVEKGKIVERGTHEELLRKRGVYHKLYSLQLEALKTIGIEE